MYFTKVKMIVLKIGNILKLVNLLFSICYYKIHILVFSCCIVVSRM